ncbi:hypothetical protein QQP08_011230 [Theobroma cacao]|nr:hypothetical protein QQP08_011230 [Theobroma cacao]
MASKRCLLQWGGSVDCNAPPIFSNDLKGCRHKMMKRGGNSFLNLKKRIFFNKTIFNLQVLLQYIARMIL